MTTYRWQLLRAGRFLLDGGGMFGVIPRVVWTRVAPCDDKNRVELSHNCLLLESTEPDPVLGRPRRVLIEAGTGDKLDAKMSAIFGLDGRTVETAVVEAGVDVGAIDHVIVSHLHFDHAGGLTRRVREGEEPDWEATKPGSASGDEPRVKFTFPNAELIVQRREWVDARNNDAVMTRTYYRDHILPFEDESKPLSDGRPRLRQVDAQRPFPLNRKPSRDEKPKTSVDERMTEVLPGIRVFLTPGHTWGQQAVAFEDDRGRTVVFTPDLMPTAWHVGQAYSLSYDVEPYTSMVTKGWFLDEAAERGWTLVLDHEPGNPVRTVRRTEGWYELDEAEG
ncbi:MAG: MBL fold metallo-hydrolase [Phycisphaerales bacterium]|nr:MBL fold metallo-hydrolase [Planctomycetota bacterium]MCH8508312.1 MBL fold metallo-hydrolase [Phycisphaerales bacterium]